MSHYDEAIQFVDIVNAKLAKPIGGFQDPFNEIINLLKSRVLSQMGFSSEHEIDLKKINAKKEYHHLESWVYSYTDPILGHTVCKIYDSPRKGLNIFNIDSKNIKLSKSLGTHLTVVSKAVTYEISAYEDYSCPSVSLKQNDQCYTYTNGMTEVFGTGSFVDCIEDELFLCLRSTFYNPEDTKIYKKIGLRDRPKNKEELAIVAKFLEIQPTISWKNLMSDIKKELSNILSPNKKSEVT